MDNHPIPQDVTGFQFKLIGSMTIKQFGYVLGGVIIAAILYYLPLNSALGILFKTIFIPLIGGSGLLLAFLPIEGRPVDVMIGNFMRALFAPNQFVYQKTGRLFSFSSIPAPKTVVGKPQARPQTAMTPDKTQQLQQLLNASHIQKQNPLDMKEATFLQSFSSPTAPPAVQPAVQPQPVLQQHPVQQQQPLPSTPQHNDQTPDALAKQEQVLTQQLQQAKKEDQIQQARGATSEAHQKALLLERQVQTLHFQRQQLEEQLAYLKKQLDVQKQPSSPSPTVPPAPAATPAQQTAQPSKAAPQDAGKKVGLPHTPDTPNVIAGVVRDPRGNVLPNILVEVKDKDGNPVRAFKTNTLGQFASATPLTPGYYTVELEDPKKQNTFNIIQLAATNQILLPIEIISHDAREELRKQLFN